MTRKWFVDETRAPVTWSEAVVDGVATRTILMVVDPGDPGGVSFDVLWAAPGQAVPVTRVTDAQADADPGTVPDVRRSPAGAAVVAVDGDGSSPGPGRYGTAVYG